MKRVGDSLPSGGSGRASGSIVLRAGNPKTEASGKCAEDEFHIRIGGRGPSRQMADQISDADAVLKEAPKGRVACETLLTTGLVVVSGEITTSTYVDIPAIVRATIQRIGYTRAKFGFDYETCGVITSIHDQSGDIAQGVERAFEMRTDPGDQDECDRQGAGDQGMVFGYACLDTAELMPLPISLAHRLVHRAAETRRGGLMPYLRPDAKSQVTVRYRRAGRSSSPPW